ncbi:MAG: PhoU domain-containing protein, partial [Cellulosilyticum sp.]|nr:PhoU domain-containing protein [Cellulosilyticum sp.]
AIVGIIGFKFFIPEIGATPIDVTQISIVHTIFNVLNTILLFPFAGLLVVIAEKLIKDGENEGEANELQHLDERILETPSFAVENAVKEVIRMADIAMENTKDAVEALLDKDEKKIEQVFEKEKTINELQRGINHYLIKLSNATLSEEEKAVVTRLFHIVSDIERVGDHADNIAEIADQMVQEGLTFSDKAIKELREITDAAIVSFEYAIQGNAFKNPEIAKKTLPLEEQVDKMEAKLRSRHMKRLADETCSPIAGILFLDTLSNIERISDHASNIALSILDENYCFTSEEMNLA